MQDSAAEAVEPRTMDKLGDADTAGFAWRKMAGWRHTSCNERFSHVRVQVSSFTQDIYRYFANFAIPLARIAQW